MPRRFISLATAKMMDKSWQFESRAAWANKGSDNAANVYPECRSPAKACSGSAARSCVETRRRARFRGRTYCEAFRRA
eukprot:2657479-Pyramimonas_sp.AAC.1